MRPWLRIDATNTSTNFAFTDHEVHRRAQFDARYQTTPPKKAGTTTAKGDTEESQEPQEPQESEEDQEHKNTTHATTSSVFDRLSDTTFFTGSHKHRFDPITGQGRGAQGRSAAVKGEVEETTLLKMCNACIFQVFSKSSRMLNVGECLTFQHSWIPFNTFFIPNTFHRWTRGRNRLVC